MAKLGVYYGLCPIIDHRSLLGIHPDQEEGNVVVTLGKNFAIRYKLLDQKQQYSWRTKEKFTSPILFDQQEQKYVAAFNQSYLRVWSSEDEFLDKIKKIKLRQKIHTIFECKKCTFVVFTNGAIVTLAQILLDKKSVNYDDIFDCSSNYIVDVLHTVFNDEMYVGLLVKSADSHLFYWTRWSDEQSGTSFNTIQVSRAEFELSGCLLHAEKGSVNFLTLWSNGRLFSSALQETDDFEPEDELLTSIEAISCKDYVSMRSLDENYIALYGCDTSDEGALLLIYNIQFKVIQSRQPFKLFTKGAKLWTIDSNMFLPVGQYLAVVPFYLHTEQLAALVGSHKVIAAQADADVCIVHRVETAVWSADGAESGDASIADAIAALIGDYLAQGLPENLILAEIVPGLIDGGDLRLMAAVLEHFCDFPDACLVRLIRFALRPPAGGGGRELEALLDRVLAKVFNEALILGPLHRELTLDEVAALLRHICALWAGGEALLPGLDGVGTERRLVEWGCALVDANYQKLILARDEAINRVLDDFRRLVDGELDGLRNLSKLRPLVVEARNGRSIYKVVPEDLSYSVEKLVLY